MFSRLWGRITGADKRRQFPEQQAVFLGRTGNYTVVFPYGLYGDLPEGTLLKEISRGVAVPVTVVRPGDTEQGEPVFYHPATETRIIARNSGDLDILVGDEGGTVRVVATDVVVEASGDATVTAGGTATIDAPETQITGNATVGGNLQVGGDFNNDGRASLGGPGGQPIARQDDPTDGSKIVTGSGNHTAT